MSSRLPPCQHCHWAAETGLQTPFPDRHGTTPIARCHASTGAEALQRCEPNEFHSRSPLHFGLLPGPQSGSRRRWGGRTGGKSPSRRQDCTQLGCRRSRRRCRCRLPACCLADVRSPRAFAHPRTFARTAPRSFPQAAQALAHHNVAVTLADMGGRGPGGRVASRTLEQQALAFDSGTQLITAIGPDFRKQVAEWQAAGVLAEWRGRHGQIVAGEEGGGRLSAQSHTSPPSSCSCRPDVTHACPFPRLQTAASSWRPAARRRRAAAPAPASAGP